MHISEQTMHISEIVDLGPDNTITAETELPSNLSSVTSLDNVTLAEGVGLYGLSSVRSLDSVTFAEGVELHDLSSVTSLDNVTLAEGVGLHGLSSVTSLDNVTFAEGVRLSDLSSGIALPAWSQLSSREQETLRKIVEQVGVDRIDMDTWHCGTTHCLAGAAQLVDGRVCDDDTALADGWELLPTLAPYFFAPTEAVRKWLEEIRDQLAQEA